MAFLLSAGLEEHRQGFDWMVGLVLADEGPDDNERLATNERRVLEYSRAGDGGFEEERGRTNATRRWTLWPVLDQLGERRPAEGPMSNRIESCGGSIFSSGNMAKERAHAIPR